MKLARPVLILAGLTAWSGLALAQTIGNPVPEINNEQLGLGLSLERFSRDLSFENGGSDSVDYSRMGFRADYGLGKNQALQIYIGQATVDPGPGNNWSGPELGIGYRQPVDITIPIAGKGAPTAIFGDIRYGNLEDGSTFKYFQYEFGYGGSFPASKELNVYAAVLYSDVYGRIGGKDVSAVDNLGFMGGVEFAATKGLRLTGELHILHEFGIGLMVQFFL
jgi:hypothetical protein